MNNDTDAIHRHLSYSAIIELEKVAPGILLDFSEANQVVAAKMYHLSNSSDNLHLSTLEFVII